MKSSDLSQYTSHKKVLMFSKEDISDYQKVIEKYALISLDADSQKAIIFKAEPNPKACIELVSRYLSLLVTFPVCNYEL